MSEWISVKDRLPKSDGFYLAWFTFEDGLHGYDIFYYNCGVSLPSSLTHWMPLPEPPESEEKKEDAVFFLPETKEKPPCKSKRFFPGY